MESQTVNKGNWFKRHKILTGILILFLLGIIVSAAGGSSDKNTASKQSTAASSANSESPKQAEPKKERLTLDEGWSLDQSNPYMTKVIGTVSNNSDQDIKGYIQITFSAYDASGANVGDCLANANTVDANGKWKFEAMCSGNNITQAKFKDISGF